MSEYEKPILFDFIHNPVIADAVLDGLSRDRFYIKLRSDSLRRPDANFDTATETEGIDP